MDTNYSERSDAVTPDMAALGTPDKPSGEPGKDKMILVPLDGSGFAEAVIAHAITMAAATHAKIRFLRVVPPPTLIEPVGMGFTPSPSVWEAWAEEPARARLYLSSLDALLNKRGLGVDADTAVDTVVLQGDPASSIVEYAQEHPEVALIAMSTHGRSGISRWFMGSVAEKVLHSSPVPMLLVRAQERDTLVGDATQFPVRQYRTILVPLDGSSLAEQALKEAQTLATQLSATLQIVSVIPPVENWEMVAEASTPFRIEDVGQEQLQSVTRYLQSVAERLREEGLTVQEEVDYGEPAEQILRRSESGVADLIVMCSHGRSGLLRMWLGSVAMKVMHAANVPVPMVRAVAASTEEDNMTPRHEELPALI